jgi:hypothetical protein
MNKVLNINEIFLNETTNPTKLPLHFPTTGEVVAARIRARIKRNMKFNNIVYMKQVSIKHLLK